MIEIGKHKLKYFNDKPAAAETSDFEKTMIIRKPAAAAAPPPPPPKPAFVPPAPAVAAKLGDTHTNIKPLEQTPQPVPAAAPPPMGAKVGGRDGAIQVLSGGAAGRSMDLVKNLTTIGKPGTQVAVITRRPTGYFITHVEGAKFPTLNGVTLGGQAQQLNDHDLIEIAGVKMEFFFKP